MLMVSSRNARLNAIRVSATWICAFLYVETDDTPYGTAVYRGNSHCYAHYGCGSVRMNRP